MLECARQEPPLFVLRGLLDLQPGLMGEARRLVGALLADVDRAVVASGLVASIEGAPIGPRDPWVMPVPDGGVAQEAQPRSGHP